MRPQHPPDDDKAAHEYEQWRQAKVKEQWNPNGVEPEPDFPGDVRE